MRRFFGPPVSRPGLVWPRSCSWLAGGLMPDRLAEIEARWYNGVSSPSDVEELLSITDTLVACLRWYAVRPDGYKARVLLKQLGLEETASG
jgi:hypothetical protein